MTRRVCNDGTDGFVLLFRCLSNRPVSLQGIGQNIRAKVYKSVFAFDLTYYIMLNNCRTFNNTPADLLTAAKYGFAGVLLKVLQLLSICKMSTSNAKTDLYTLALMFWRMA